MKSIQVKLLLLSVLSLLLVSSVYPFVWNKTLELQCKSSEIILPDGRIIKDYIGCVDDKAFIPSELVEDILGKQLYWDKDNDILYVGTIPTATVMSDKVKIYHYDYDTVHAFLYCPDAKTNKPMTMAGQVHDHGYYFTNVFSASFNLGGAYHELSGYLGCEDFKASDGQVDFYVDDTLVKTCQLKSGSLPEKINLHVDAGNKLTLVFSYFKPDTQIDFADVYIH